MRREGDDDASPPLSKLALTGSGRQLLLQAYASSSPPLGTPSASDADETAVAAVDMESARELRALERFIVREVVYDLLAPFLSPASSSEAFDPRGDSLAAKAFRTLAECPLFRSAAAIGGGGGGGGGDADQALMAMFRLLPRIDQSLKTASRRGVDRHLTSLICGPLLSQLGDAASRAASPRYTLSWAMRRILLELTEPGGVAEMLEEIKATHCIAELRASVRELIDVASHSVARSLWRDVADATKRAKMASTLARVPRGTLIRLLKVNVFSGSTLLSLWRIFTVQMAGFSLAQKLATSALGLDTLQRQQDECRSRLVAAWVPLLDAMPFISLDYSQPAKVGAMRDQVCAALASEFPRSPALTDAQKWDVLFYLQLKVRIQSAQALVQLVADAEVVEICHMFLLSNHKHVLGPMLAHGSGLVFFTETLFEAWDELVNTAASLEAVRAIVDRVVAALFLLVKRVLINDQVLILHQTASWAVGRFKHARSAAARVPNFAAAVAALPEDEQRAVRAEAHALLARERFNNSRPPGVPRVPRPVLVASQSLVDQWAASDGGLWDLVTAPVPLVDGASLVVNKPSARASPLSDVEVTFDFEAPTDMAARGFIKAGVMGSTTLWVRKAAASPLPPITRVALVHGSAAAHHGWTLVRRNLNKGAGGTKAFLAYRRQAGEAPLMGVALADAEAALGAGWRRVGVVRQGRVFVSEFGLFCASA